MAEVMPAERFNFASFLIGGLLMAAAYNFGEQKYLPMAFDLLLITGLTWGAFFRRKVQR